MFIPTGSVALDQVALVLHDHQSISCSDLSDEGLTTTWEEAVQRLQEQEGFSLGTPEQVSIWQLDILFTLLAHKVSWKDAVVTKASSTVQGCDL